MAVTSISSVITAGFIRSFQGLADSDGPKIGAGAGQAASVYSGLRLGARTFAASIQNLNSAIGVVNISENTLKKLDKIVDKMIGVAEKGTSLSVGSESRRKLQAEFQDLVNDFRDVTDNTELNDIDYLTTEGLATLFERVGLDKETSDGLATVFKKFVEAEDEGVLASEETKGPRPPYVPSLRKSRTSQVSDSSLPTDSQGISPDYSVYMEDDIAFTNQPYAVDAAGNITGQAPVTSNQDLLSVNPRNGYTLITSAQDLTGDNPGTTEQAFLIAPDGTVVRQVTNLVGANDIIYGDMSADNLRVTVTYNDGIDTYIDVISVASISDPPASSTVIDHFAAVGTSLKISPDGNHIAYDSTADIIVKEVGGPSTYSFGSSPSRFDFSSESTVVYTDTLSGGYFNNIYSYDFLSLQSRTLVSEENMTQLAVLANDSTYSSNDGSPTGSPKISALAYNTYVNGSSNRLTVLSFDPELDYTKTRYRKDLGSGTVNQISLSYQADSNTSKDRVDVGIVGTLPSLFADGDLEMYRVSESKFALNSSLFASPSSDPTNILDGNVLTRADSYRLLADLKALKEQMNTNLGSLADTRQYILDNIELVRSAGFAFLNISNQISGTEDADQVAKLVASEIRRNTPLALLSHSENITNIVSQTTALLEDN